MGRSILLLLAGALLIEAALITMMQPTTPRAPHFPAMALPQPAAPTAQTTIFRPPNTNTSTPITALAIACSAFAGFIIGYVNYR